MARGHDERPFRLLRGADQHIPAVGPPLSYEHHPVHGGFLGRTALREKVFSTGDTRQNADLAASRNDWLEGRRSASAIEPHTRTISLFARYLAAVTRAASSAVNKVPA